MLEKNTLILPQIGVSKATIETALMNLCVDPSSKLDITFLGRPEELMKTQGSSLAVLSQCVIESQIHTQPMIIERLRIAFSYPEFATELGSSLSYEIVSKQGQKRSLQFNVSDVNESCWGLDTVIPDEAKASFSLPTIVPYMHCGTNKVDLSYFGSEDLLNAASNLESVIDCLTYNEDGIMSRASRDIPFFKSNEKTTFDPNWKLKFTDQGFKAAEPEVCREKVGDGKTKHFVYYTGGTDSTLIASTIIRLMETYEDDELVIVLVKHSNLASGQEDRLNAAIEYLAANLVDLAVPDSVIKRISLAIPANETISSHNVGRQSIKVSIAGEMVEFPLFKIDPNEQAVLRHGTSAQESLLVATAGLLAPLLGKCRNVFYIGFCSGDAAISSTKQLRDYFAHSFKMIVDANKDIDKDWMPTLEMPLETMRKSDVVYNLEVLGCRNFAVDKSEDLLMHYFQNNSQHLANEKTFSKPDFGISDGKTNDDFSDNPIVQGLMSKLNIDPNSEEFKKFRRSAELIDKQNGGEHNLLGKLKAYHSIYLSLGRPENFTAYGEFIATGKLSYTLNGKTELMPQEHINKIIEQDAAKQNFRRMGIPQTMSTDINF